MAYYEHVVLARPSMSPQQIETLTAHVSGVVTDNGGRVESTEYWGLRTLAHPIKKMRKAHYTMLSVEAPATLIAELERQARINEDIVRFLTVRVDELSEGPSVMMARKERAERRTRGTQREESQSSYPVRSDSNDRDGAAARDDTE